MHNKQLFRHNTLSEEALSADGCACLMLPKSLSVIISHTFICSISLCLAAVDYFSMTIRYIGNYASGCVSMSSACLVKLTMTDQTAN